MCGGFFMEALRILNVSVYLYNTDAATVHVSFFTAVTQLTESTNNCGKSHLLIHHYGFSLSVLRQPPKAVSPWLLPYATAQTETERQLWGAKMKLNFSIKIPLFIWLSESINKIDIARLPGITASHECLSIQDNPFQNSRHGSPNLIQQNCTFIPSFQDCY